MLLLYKHLGKRINLYLLERFPEKFRLANRTIAWKT